MKEIIIAPGTLKWFNPEEGFGFIEPDGGGPDVCVHYSAIASTGYGELSEGQKASSASEEARRDLRQRTSHPPGPPSLRPGRPGRKGGRLPGRHERSGRRRGDHRRTA